MPPCIAESIDFGATSVANEESSLLLSLPDCILGTIFAFICGGDSPLDASSRLTCSAARGVWDRSRNGAKMRLRLRHGEDHKIGTLARLLGRLHDCTTLHLEGALSPQLPQALDPSLLHRVREITLSGCPLSPLAASALENMNGLSSLELLGCSLDFALDLGRWLASCLSLPMGRPPSVTVHKPQPLERLSLRGCRMGPEAAWILAECLRSSSSSSSSSNAVKMGGGDHGGIRPSSPLVGLRYLDLSHNCLGDEGARAVAEILEIIMLSSTLLVTCPSSSSPTGSPPMIPNPSSSPAPLLHLDLGFNGIGALGARHLAGALASPSSSSSSSLNHLSLAGNRLGLEVGLILAAALKGGGGEGGLHHFDLSWTGLGEEGVSILAKTLGFGGISTLRHLDLSGNCFGDQDRQEVGEAIEVFRGSRKGCEILI